MAERALPERIGSGLQQAQRPVDPPCGMSAFAVSIASLKPRIRRSNSRWNASRSNFSKRSSPSATSSSRDRPSSSPASTGLLAVVGFFGGGRRRRGMWTRPA